ncbi:MAG: NifU family protein [Bacilli bacterium]|nr:NifU family protein [Bacilli bacterium]
MEVIDHIKFILDKIRPFLLSDGGDVEFVKFEDGIVYVKLIGACANCEIADSEIKDTVETILTSEIPEVLEVRNIEN